MLVCAVSRISRTVKYSVRFRDSPYEICGVKRHWNTAWFQASARDAEEICALLRSYAEWVRNFLWYDILSVNEWSEVMCSDVEWSGVIYVKWLCCEVMCSDVEWSDVIYVKWLCCEVMWSDVEWSDVIYVKWLCFEVMWSEVSYAEILRDKSNMHIRVTLYWSYLIVLRLSYLVCILYCGCFSLFCNVWVCVCVGVCMCVGVCLCGCVYVWVCVCVGFVTCGCFGNMCICIYCVFVLFRLCIFILICYWYKNYCHRVKTQLQ